MDNIISNGTKEQKETETETENVDNT